ncbi:MAG TPA: ring-cleaving dioxygenase [Abditibacteriaceae bacterium]|jgi:glyoxalase family protein
MQLSGIHHLTAVSGDIRANHRFYTQVLGMRLVKRSVNQDDVSAYHLFYADAVGSPGTDLTFFDWAMPAEKRGTHSVTRTFLRVTGAEAIDWWAGRLKELGVVIGEPVTRDGRLTLEFEDGEGQRLALVDDAGAGDQPQIWNESPVPAEYQIRGLGPIVLSVPDVSATEEVFLDVLNMRRVREYAHPDAQTVIVYEMGEGGPHAELHVMVQPQLEMARLGAGGVHHVALRTPDEAQYHKWFARLREKRIATSGEIDRYYFRSLYFREPNGILFEIATDGPGFGVDENPQTLGQHIALPPFLESRRAEIVAGLKPLD